MRVAAPDVEVKAARLSAAAALAFERDAEAPAPLRAADSGLGSVVVTELEPLQAPVVRPPGPTTPG